MPTSAATVKTSPDGNFRFIEGETNKITRKENPESFVKMMRLLDEGHEERLALDKKIDGIDGSKEISIKKLKVEIKMRILAALACLSTSKEPRVDFDDMKARLEASSDSREDMQHIPAFAEAVKEILIGLELV